MTNNTKELLKILIPIISIIMSFAIVPIVKIYSSVELLKEKNKNRKDDILRLHDHDKELFNSITQLKTDVAYLKGQLSKKYKKLDK